jgi:hypothetical protein
MLEMLKELAPLPKPHYSDDVAPSLLLAPTPEFVEVCRICRCVPVDLESPNDVIAAAASLAHSLSVPLVINYSPWPNETCPAPGPVPIQLSLEINRVARRLNVCSMIFGTNKVAAAILDDERYGDHTKAMTPWRNAMFETFKMAMPEASVEFYDRCGLSFAAEDSGWTRSKIGDEVNSDFCGAVLYRLSDHRLTQETLRMVSVANPGKRIAAYIALGYCEEYAVGTFSLPIDSPSYPLTLDWLTGWEMHSSWCASLPDRFAPWGRVHHVTFWPAFMQGPQWLPRFVAYCRGAQEIKCLDGLSI